MTTATKPRPAKTTAKAAFRTVRWECDSPFDLLMAGELAPLSIRDASGERIYCVRLAPDGCGVEVLRLRGDGVTVSCLLSEEMAEHNSDLIGIDKALRHAQRI